MVAGEGVCMGTVALGGLQEKDEKKSRLNAEANIYGGLSLVPDSMLNILYPLILFNLHYILCREVKWCAHDFTASK